MNYILWYRWRAKFRYGVYRPLRVTVFGHFCCSNYFAVIMHDFQHVYKQRRLIISSSSDVVYFHVFLMYEILNGHNKRTTVWMNIYSSFSVIHKVGNIGVLVLLKFEDKVDREISHFTMTNKLALKLIWLLTASILFPIKIVQKCQLCVLRENSIRIYMLQNGLKILSVIRLRKDYLLHNKTPPPRLIYHGLNSSVGVHSEVFNTYFSNFNV